MPPGARLLPVMGVRLDNLEGAEPDFELLEAAPLATSVYDPDGNCVYANAAWEELWGLPRAVALRQNIVHDAATAAADVPLIRRAFAGERTELPVAERRTPRGARQIRTHLAPFQTARGTHVIARFEDVTDRAQERSMRKAVLAALSDMGVGIVAFEGMRILWANDAYERITGYSLAELTSPTFSLARLSVTSSEDDIERRMAERAAGMHQETRRVAEIRRKDGTHVRVEVRSRTTERGPPPKLVGVVRVLED